MEAAVFILSLIDCCALIFLSVYFVSFLRNVLINNVTLFILTHSALENVCSDGHESKLVWL